MEAIPRLPMLSFDLKRSPEYVEFGPVLKQYIKTHYGEDQALYNKACSDLEQLRQETTQVVCDYLGCTTLKKYYAQLQFLQGRFPMKEGEEAAIPFTWEDVQTGRDHVGDIKFEQACILYNIGSLHSLLGVLDTRQNAEGMKVSCTHFQCAAWAFESLRDNFGSSSMSTDMSFELLSFHILLMLAQAQECILEKSMLDGRKNNITAKVAVQVVDFYRQAINAIDTCDAKHQINSRMHKEWRKRMTVKMTLYQCITYYYQGRQSEEAEKRGECLAFFTGAKDKLAEASKLAKNEVAEIAECLKYCQDVVLGKYESAKKDNDFVYHDKVPPVDSLPEVKGASLVKGIPFNPNDKEVSGPDIFHKLVPMEAHEASSVYSEEKAKLMRTVKGSIEQKNTDLDQFMSSLQLDMEQLMPKPDTMPEHLMEKCAAMSVRTNAIQELTDSMAEVSGLATEVELGINETHELIDTDTTKTTQFEEQYGRKKPSKVLPGLLSELTSYKERHVEGSQLNTTLHKAMNKLTNNLKLLCLSPSEIITQLPPSQPELSPEEDAIVSEVRRLLQKVNEMREQRNDFLDKLMEQLHKDDITNALVTQDSSDKDQLYADQLKKHDALVQHINMNLSAQENILRSLTDANAKFAMIRQTFAKAASKREKTIQELILSYEKYEDLLAKCAKGSDYYKKLFDNVNKTLDRCRSECKIRQEERDMLISQFAPKVTAPSRPSAPKPRVGTGITPTNPNASFLDPTSMIPIQPADVTNPSGLQTMGPDVLSTFPANLPPAFEGPKLKDYLPFMKPRSFGPKPQSSQADLSSHPLTPNIPPESPQPLDTTTKRPNLDPNLASVLPASLAQYIASSVAPSMSFPKSNNNQHAQNQINNTDPRNSNAINPQLPHSSPLRRPLPPGSPLPQTAGHHSHYKGGNDPPSGAMYSGYYNNPSLNNTALPHQQQPGTQATVSQYPQTLNQSGPITQPVHPTMPHHQSTLPSSVPHLPSNLADSNLSTYPTSVYLANQFSGHTEQHGLRPDITNTVSASNRPVLSSGKDLTSTTTPTQPPQQPPFGTYQQPAALQYQQQQQQLQSQYQHPYYNPGLSAPRQPTPPPAQLQQQQQFPAGGEITAKAPHQAPVDLSSNPGYQNYPYPSSQSSGPLQPQPHQAPGGEMTNHNQAMNSVSATPPQIVPTSASYALPTQQQMGVSQHGQQQQQQLQPSQNYQQQPGHFKQHPLPPLQQQHQPQQPPQKQPMTDGNNLNLQSQTHYAYNQNAQTPFNSQYLASQQYAGQNVPASQHPGQNVPTRQQYSGQNMPCQQYPVQNVPAQQFPGQNVPRQPYPGLNAPTSQQYPRQNAPTNQQFPGQNSQASQQFPGQNVSSQQCPGQNAPTSQQYPGQNASNQYPGQYQTSGVNYSPRGSPAKINPNTVTTNLPMSDPGAMPNIVAPTGKAQTAAFQQQQQQQLATSQPYTQQYQQQPQALQHPHNQSQLPQLQQHPYIQQPTNPQQHMAGLNQPRPQMNTVIPGGQGQVQGQATGTSPNPMQSVTGFSTNSNQLHQRGLNSHTSDYSQITRPAQAPTPTQPLPSAQGTTTYQGYQPKQHTQQGAIQPALSSGYGTQQHLNQQQQSISSSNAVTSVLQTYPNQQPMPHQVFPPQQYQSTPGFYQTGQPSLSHPQAHPSPALATSNVPPGIYGGAAMQQPLQPQPLSKPVPPLPAATVTTPSVPQQQQQYQPLPQPGLAPQTPDHIIPPRSVMASSMSSIAEHRAENFGSVPPLPSPSSPAPPGLQVVIPSTPSTPPISIGRQNSSLDDILSSSPNGATNSLPITPQVLTDQERQLEKEQAKKNLSQPPVTMEPYGSQGALHKLLSDVEAFGQLVDNLSLSILGVSRLDSIWKSLVDCQELNSKKQSMAIARCYPMKNRDPDIMPYDETRVILTSTKDDYINASWLNDLAPSCPKFITTQSPLPQTCVDFWSMVYEQGTEVLVQITSEYETGKLFPVYYPTEREKPLEQGPLIISLQSVKFRQNWVERIVYLKNNVTKQGRTVVHLQFKSWPVSGFPDDVASIVHFISEVHNFYKQQRSLTKPIIVHCGIGAGRAGVLVMVYASIQELVHGNGLLDIQGLAKKILHKRKDILLKQEQLYCVYQCLLCFAEDFLNKRGILVKTPHFSSTTTTSSTSKDASGGSSREGSNPPSTHAVDDIVFGNVDIETIRANIGLLHVTSDKDKKQPTQSIPKPGSSAAPSMPSLPDVVQRDDRVGGHSDEAGNMTLGSEFSRPHQDKTGENVNGNSDGAGGALSQSSATPSDSTASGDKTETKSSLAQLQDPLTFTLGSPEKHQPRITKANFSKEEGRLTNLGVDPSSTDDPLASLDPLWSLGK